MEKEKLMAYLGLATKAGKLVTGYNTCLDMMPRGKIKLVVLAEDVGDNTKKKLSDKCRTYDIPCFIGAGADEMSRATGKSDKGVFGIIDMGFAKGIEKLFHDESKDKNKPESEVF